MLMITFLVDDHMLLYAVLAGNIQLASPEKHKEECGKTGKYWWLLGILG
jgi:hypothetical protein